MVVSLLFCVTAYLLFYGKLPHVILLPGSLCLLIFCAWFRRRCKHIHEGHLPIDRIAHNSGLRGTHTGLKACVCLASIVICLCARSNLVSLFVAASMLFLAIGPGKTPLGQYLRFLAMPLAFILLGTIPLLAQWSFAPMGLLDIPLGNHYLSVTAGSQNAALALGCRALGAASCLLFLGLSTPAHQIIALLRRGKVPALVTELMYLIYRYIFILTETLHQMQVAAQARLGYRNWRVSLQTTCSIAFRLLFLSFRRSSESFAAMEARCYSGTTAFLIKEHKLNKYEALAATAYLFLLLLLWRLARVSGL